MEVKNPPSLEMIELHNDLKAYVDKNHTESWVNEAEFMRKTELSEPLYRHAE